LRNWHQAGDRVPHFVGRTIVFHGTICRNQLAHDRAEAATGFAKCATCGSILRYRVGRRRAMPGAWTINYQEQQMLFLVISGCTECGYGMTALLAHLDRVSVFGPSAVALFLILGLDWAFSALHTYQEWRGAKAPLWRVFGAVVGVWLPNWLGFLVFTIMLTLALWCLGLAGIAGWFPVAGPLPEAIAVWALGAVIGARISDTLVSHWRLYALGYRPNPGLSSTSLYVLEAVFIVLTFWKGLSLYPRAAWLGFAFGAVLFVLVLPALRGTRVIIPLWRRPPWIRWQPLPEWATK